MTNKYVCPKCNSQLKAYKEYVFQKEQLINTRTGQLNKIIKKTNAEKIDTPGGLECTKCDFRYYGLDCISNEGKEYIYLNELFEIINESKFNSEIA